MRKTATKAFCLAIGTLSLSAAPPVFAQDETGADAVLTEGEIKLAEMLEGRVAEEPQSCIRFLPNSRVTVIDRTAIVYETGSRLYVNVPRNVQSLDDDDTMVRRTSVSTRLCKMDIITTIDQVSGIYTGNIHLGDFIPYRKVDS